MPIGTPVYIEAPAVAAAPGGLYAVARIIEGDRHLGASGIQYLAETCGVANVLDDPACTPADERPTKTFDEIDVISGDPFAVYKGTQCTDMTGDDTSWARTGLELTEHMAVEQAVMSGVLQGATDLTPTPGTAVSVVRGLAILEGYAAANYGGVPVIHAARSTVTHLFANDVVEHDLTFTVTTGQGALVANGGGYETNLGPTGVAAPEGQAWMYVTGAVTVARTPIEVVQVLGASEALNIQNALAERFVAVAVECIKAAVLVDLEA